MPPGSDVFVDRWILCGAACDYSANKLTTPLVDVLRGNHYEGYTRAAISCARAYSCKSIPLRTPNMLLV